MQLYWHKTFDSQREDKEGIMYLQKYKRHPISIVLFVVLALLLAMVVLACKPGLAQDNEADRIRDDLSRS